VRMAVVEMSVGLNWKKTIPRPVVLSERNSAYFLQQVQASPHVQLSPQLHPSLQTGHVCFDLQQVQSGPQVHLSPQLQASLHTGQVISATKVIRC
jgi:hypothetical protein